MIVGEPGNCEGGIARLRENGFVFIDLKSEVCRGIFEKLISENPSTWNEDIGQAVEIPAI